MDTSAWVTRPECPKGCKLEVGAQRAPKLLVPLYFYSIPAGSKGQIRRCLTMCAPTYQAIMIMTSIINIQPTRQTLIMSPVFTSSLFFS